MELADFLAGEAVIVCSNVKDKSELLSILAKRGAELTGEDAARLYEALSAREELGSTGLGNGIAIPHGKIAGLERVVAVFAKLTSPIEFDSVDDMPVDLVVMLLAPLGQGADHLKALARMARLLRTESVVERLREAETPTELYAILTEPQPATFAA